MDIEDCETPLTPEGYQAFVSALGLTPPDSFRAPVLAHNGGWPEADQVYGEDIEVEVAGFHPIAAGRHPLLEVRKRLVDLLPEGWMPFAFDAGGAQFCLDLSEDGAGKVYFWLNGDTTPLADSFQSFLACLEEPEDE